ncbi:MAG: hypothetical protein SWY16_26450, partial [Cyanobacteriota bacterium]|nr:hypothetical protein [Cyanobacteriota bacterium]
HFLHILPRSTTPYAFFETMWHSKVGKTKEKLMSVQGDCQKPNSQKGEIEFSLRGAIAAK